MAKAQKPDAQDVSDQVAETANTIETVLRNTIANQPYTAIAIALGVGWLLGRMHRPF